MRLRSIATVPALVGLAVLGLAGCASGDDDAPPSSAPASSAAPSPSATPEPSPSSDEQVLDPYLQEIQSVDPLAYFAFYATVQPGEATTHEYALDVQPGSVVVRVSCASVDGDGVRWTLSDPATGEQVSAGTSTCAQQAEPGESAPPATASSPIDVPGTARIVVESTGTVSGAVGLVAAG